MEVVFFFTSEYIIRAAISDKIFEKHNKIYIMEILTTRFLSADLVGQSFERGTPKNHSSHVEINLFQWILRNRF